MINSRDRFGEFRINDGKDLHVIKNRIMDAAINKEISILKGEAPDLEIKYFAIGTGTTAVTNADTQLDNEHSRYPVVSGPTLTTTGEITTEFTIRETEGQIVIQEIGIFCGSTATASLNTGTLLARALWTYDKTGNIELSISRIDRLSRG